MDSIQVSSNGALPYMSLSSQLNLSPATEGLVSSSLIFGAAFGAISGGKLADTFGRKKMINVFGHYFLLCQH
ncbi:transporter [Staphylococcus gallinarum]|uniref:Transporter n=1 Tax=Staphylococcus gallinarum TaxID=1293 RepID=A0A380F998_STAGA|nr:transporter [Staphylococcus gallinarum]